MAFFISLPYHFIPSATNRNYTPLALAGGSRLDFIIGDGAGPAITAATAGIGANVALNISGITAGGTGARFTLINTAGGITGDFNPVTIAAGAANPDYLSFNAAKSADGKNYTIDAALAWNRADGGQHGTFTLGAGEEFTIAAVLADNAATGTAGWDSRSLTKAGDGTLVLAAPNTYTGPTAVTGGTLRLAAAGAIARSAAVDIAAGAVLAAGAAQTLQNLSGSGTLAPADETGAPLFTLHSTADTTFSGIITGSGGIVKTGPATLALAAAGTYEGDTTVAAGRLAIASLAALGAGTAATLHLGSAGTLGFALDTATGGTLAQTLAGAGVFQATGTAGTLALDRDNPAFAGTFALAGGLTEVVTTSTAISAFTESGTQFRKVDVSRVVTLCRDGEIIAASDPVPVGGTVTVATAAVTATTIHVTATAARGARLLAAAAGAFGAGAVAIGESGTLEYRGVSGTSFAAHDGTAASGAAALAAGAGYTPPVLLVNTSTLTLAAAGGGVAAVTLGSNSVLTLAHARALGDAVSAVTVQPGARLLLAPAAALGAPGAPAAPVRLAAVTLTGGAAAGAAAVFGFAPAADIKALPAFATAEVGAFRVTGSVPASLLFNVDLSRAVTGVNPAGAAGNHLRVTGSFAGAYTVALNATGAAGLPAAVWPAGHGVSIELLRTDAAPASPAALTLAAGARIEAGVVAYELRQGDGSGLLPDPRSWYLADTGVSRVAEAIFNTAALAGEDWYYALDALHLRLGDLRATDAPSTTPLPKAGRWLRFRSYQLDGDSTLSGAPFSQYAFGLTVGADRIVRLENATLAIGALLETGIVTRRFDDGGGDGESRGFGVGVYGAWHHAAGWFADAVLKVDNYDNALGGRTGYGEINNASYNTYGLGLGAELGRRIEAADGWWLEASVQGAAVRFGASGYDTRPGGLLLRVEADASTSTQYRGQVRFGRQFRDTKLHPYARAGAARGGIAGGTIHAAHLARKPACEFGRAEFGAGFIYRGTPRSQFYFDYEYATATYYTRPWSINAGYRRAW